MTQLVYKLTSKTVQEVKDWLDQLLEHGVYFNPEPESDEIKLSISLKTEDFEESEINVEDILL